MKLPAPPRRLGPTDLDQAWALGLLAFGGDLAAVRPDTFAEREQYGCHDDSGRLLAKASLRHEGQWWGGRVVPMSGVSGVAVHPDARGRGTARALVASLLPRMPQPLSGLYPTSVALYRSLGWEIVATLDRTRLPTSGLPRRGPADVTLRSAPEDLAQVQPLYAAWARQHSGPLTREGREYPAGWSTAHVTTVARRDGVPTGYLRYDRGSGYRGGAHLDVHDLVALDAPTMTALLASLGSWGSVVEQVRLRGPAGDVQAVVGTEVAPPFETAPFMLRLVDAPRAIADRGYRPDARADVVFTLHDPLVPAQARAWRLVVHGGEGALHTYDGPAPWLDVRGLAQAYAGAVDAVGLLRRGLSQVALPGLDHAFAGPRPTILDYF